LTLLQNAVKVGEMNAKVIRIERPIDYSDRVLNIDISRAEFEELTGEAIHLSMLSWTNTEDIVDYDPDEMVVLEE
jgi:hypothetical protein